MSIREWIQKVRAAGDLLEVEGADPNVELGVVADLLQEKMEGPAVLFVRLAGYPPGYRVLANTMTSMRRLALTLGLDSGLPPLSLVAAIKDRLGDVRPLAPVCVEGGPVLENVRMGDQADLFSLPVPTLHEKDGGPYFGTGCVVIMRDPETNWVNVGTYRVMVSDRRTCTMHIVEGRHGHQIRNKYWALGKPCPVVVASGVDPLLYLWAGMEIPWGQNEMDWAGGWRGDPIRVVPGPVTGLPIPCEAEVAIEGYLSAGQVRPEGPFGEWRGYYSKAGRQEPAFEVVSVLHRDDPILVVSVPRVPPSDTTYARGILRAAMVWHQLEKAGLPGITGCWIVPWGGDRPFLVVSVAQAYPGHALQAGMMAAACPAFNYGGVVVVTVDRDIDVTDPGQVFWALSTRMNPDTDIHVLRGMWGNPVFRARGSRSDGLASRVVIDATIPWGSGDVDSLIVRVSGPWVQRVREKWPHILSENRGG